MSSKLALLATAGSLALSLGLVGCGGPAPSASPTGSASPNPTESATPTETPTPEPTAHPSIAPSSSIDAITVDGEFGKTPTVNIKTPFAVDETRSRVVIAGKGAPVTAKSFVDINYHGVNAYTGKTFDSSFTRGQSAQFSLEGVVPGFSKGLDGKHVGDRVLIVIPGKDGYDSSGGSGDGQILVGDTLVFVVDILDIQYDKPFGAVVTPAAGLPTVTDNNGKPDVAINSSATPPTATVVQPLVAGAGTHKLAAGDTVVDHYRMYSWKTGKLLADDFDQPVTVRLADAIPCARDGLVGQPLGSRVLLVCPPATGYPNGSTKPQIDAGDTVVIVVDLMFASAG